MLKTIWNRIARKKTQKQLWKYRLEHHQSVSKGTDATNATLSDYVSLFGGNFRQSKIGCHTYVGAGAFMPNTYIGSFCSIAEDVRVVYARHPLEFVSTYSGFYHSLNSAVTKYNDELSFNEFIETKSGFYAEIGNDVWIGDRVLIKGGVTIGDGAVIGMGSVVTRDVPPYAIVAGVPAKVIRFRFSNEEIAFLKTVEWWNWDEEKLQRFGRFFNDPASLRKALRSGQH